MIGAVYPETKLDFFDAGGRKQCVANVVSYGSLPERPRGCLVRADCATCRSVTHLKFTPSTSIQPQIVCLVCGESLLSAQFASYNPRNNQWLLADFASVADYAIDCQVYAVIASQQANARWLEASKKGIASTLANRSLHRIGIVPAEANVFEAMDCVCNTCGTHSRFQFSQQTCYTIDTSFPCCPVCGSYARREQILFYYNDGSCKKFGVLDSQHNFHRAMLGCKMISNLVRYEKHCLAELAIALPHVPALLLNEIFEYWYLQMRTDLATRSTFVGQAQTLAYAALYRASCVDEEEEEACWSKKRRCLDVE